MPRIPVPDDYPHPNVSLAGTADHNYGHADINLDDRRHERNLQVREDDEGRYVGCGEDVVDAVRAFLGVTDAETCEVVKADGDVCGRELPCPYHD